MADEQATGNALRALQGESLVVDTPFEQVGRLAQAIQNGGGGGTPADYEQVKQRLSEVEAWIDILKTVSLTATIDGIEIPAAIDGIGGRVNVRGNIANLPEGYEVKALRSYNVSRATGQQGNMWQQANFNMIGTTGGGTMANLGILNNTSEIVLVKAAIQFECGKIYPSS